MYYLSLGFIRYVGRKRIGKGNDYSHNYEKTFLTVMRMLFSQL